MDGAIDDAFEADDEEAQVEEVVGQVLAEIGIDINEQVHASVALRAQVTCRDGQGGHAWWVCGQGGRGWGVRERVSADASGERCGFGVYGSFGSAWLRSCVHVRDNVFAPWPSNSDLLPVGTAPVWTSWLVLRPVAWKRQRWPRPTWTTTSKSASKTSRAECSTVVVRVRLGGGVGAGGERNKGLPCCSFFP